LGQTTQFDGAPATPPEAFPSALLKSRRPGGWVEFSPRTFGFPLNFLPVPHGKSPFFPSFVKQAAYALNNPPYFGHHPYRRTQGTRFF